MIEKSLAHPRTPPTEEHPCPCYGGLVFIGHLVEDPETGAAEPVEAFEAVPCRRCSAGETGGLG